MTHTPIRPAATVAAPAGWSSWSERARHPIWLAAGLVAATTGVAVATGVALAAAAPDSAADLRRLAAVLIVTAIALTVVAVTRGCAGRPAGARPPGGTGRCWWSPRWSRWPRWRWASSCPARGPWPSWSPGTPPRASSRRSGTAVWSWTCCGGRACAWSAVIGGALFGAAHLTNVAFGQGLAVSLAQSVGAFCFGVGFSVLRWRTGAVWLLVVIHAVGDLLFKTTALHGGALWAFLIGHDTLMLLWGLWCLRGVDDDVTRA